MRKVSWDDIYNIKFRNTQSIREAAIAFENKGKYTPYEPGDPLYEQFWDKQEELSLKGGWFPIGPLGEKIYIPGYYYFYLNFSPIMRLEEWMFDEEGNVDSSEYESRGVSEDEESGKVLVNEKSTDDLLFESTAFDNLVSDRIEGFPDFWDGDFWHFKYIDDAERHGMFGAELKVRGVGAEQPNNEIIMTPDGETTMGEIKVGDYIIDREGKPTKVLEVLPQGYKDVYEIKLMDNRTVTCGANHLWTVRLRGKKEHILKTSDLIDIGLTYPVNNGNNIGYKFSLSNIKPVKYKEKDLPIHPYIVGAMLGDGSINGHNIKIASDDKEIIDRFKYILGNDYSLVPDTTNNNYLIKINNKFKHVDEKKYPNSKYGINPLKREFELLGLNVKCKDKFIPDIYKYSSIEQRLELVCGLMDTDGSITEKGHMEFSNNNERLVDDLAYILRSLGINCRKGINNRKELFRSITDRNGRQTFHVPNTEYRLFISTNENIFHLSRKLKRINKNIIRRTKTSIVSITKKKLQLESTCLIVDNPDHIYLTKDYIPTHNSFKGGAMPCRNFYLIPKSSSFLIADDKDFLLGDGVLQKAWNVMSFIDKNTAWGKRRQYLNTSMSKRASFEADLGGVKTESGFMSSIYGITTKNDPNKVRGIRGKLILLEEAGKDPHLLAKWKILMESVKRGRRTFGFMMSFGTGGTEGSDFTGLKELFWSPGGYNIFSIPNVWSKGKINKRVAFFWPSYINSETFIDRNGNSLIEEARNYEQGVRDQISNESTDPNALSRHKAERPFIPEEATLITTHNNFPVDYLVEHEGELSSNPMWKHYGVHGYLSRKEGVVKFHVSEKHQPINVYPWPKDKDTTGCVTIWQAPEKKNGSVPANLYLMTVDPYYHDKSSGPSLGAVYVYKKFNNIFQTPSDIFVASYVARPKTLDEHIRITFMLAEYYNAKIAIENDKGRSYIDYAKRNNKLHYLYPEFDFKYNTQLNKPAISRGYGYKMASGRDDMFRNTGEIYASDWLLRIRRKKNENEENDLMNLNMIPDRALVQELIEYNKDGNFDRVDAIIGMMFFIHETQDIVPMKESEYLSGDSYFSRERTSKMFQGGNKWY